MSSAPYESAAIVELLRLRQASGLQLLYQQYGGALLHIIKRIIPAQELAEEVLQDVFVKIWQKIEQFDPAKGRLFTWMVQIARNTAIDKSRSGEINQAGKTDSLESLVNTDQYGSEAMMVRDVGLQRLIQALDEDHRIIIEYLYFRGYSHSEASEALGIPLGTIKSRLRKVLLDLRKALSTEQLLVLLALFFR